MRQAQTAMPSDRRALRLLALSAVAVFVLRAVPWALSDLWYDEIVTFIDFAVGPPRGNSFLHVFRFYPVANNHVLFSAVAWGWVRVLQFTPTEYLVRLPCVLFGALTLCWVVFRWSARLGPRLAGLAGMAFAMSPVFGPFACEFRGYSLSMLLGAVAVTAVAEFAEGNVRRGVCLYVPVALLLPLIIPTNALLVAAHLLFVAWTAVAGRRPWRTWLPQSAAVAVALALGSAYYLTIWPQFAKVAKETNGWSSGWLVMGNLALGLVAHAGPFVAAAGVLAWRHRAAVSVAGVAEPATGTAATGHGNGAAGQSVRLALCCLVVIVPLVFLRRPAPFPRVFLVFLPTFTYAALLLLRGVAIPPGRFLMLAAGAIVLHGYLWERAAAGLTQRSLRGGHYPQNLLQQYYRDSADISTLCRWVARQEDSRAVALLANAYDFPAVCFYWSLAGLPAKHVMAEDRDAASVWRDGLAGTGLQPWVLAWSEDDARRLFRLLGEEGAVTVVQATAGRRLYRIDK